VARAGKTFKMVTARTQRLPFKRKHWRVASIVLVAMVIALTGAAGFGWWRLSQGPVSLSFISGQLEGIINKRLKGISIKIRDAVIERDDKASRVHFRLRGLRLIDKSGTLIARAPRATLGLKARDFFSGNLVPTRLTLIGPNVILHRQNNGRFKLGFGSEDNGPRDWQASKGAKSDKSSAIPSNENSAKAKNDAANLLEFVLQTLTQAPKGSSTYSSFEDISIRDATVSVNDQANGTIWFAPRANFLFQRAPAGVSVLADAQIAAGKNPWNLQLSANYAKSDGNMHVVADIKNVLPSAVAAKIPWLSHLADVNLPLQGRIVVDINKDGSLRHADGRLSADAGFVAVPGVLPEPLLVDEGELGLVYSPATGDIRITDSAIFIGNSKAVLKGLISPQYDTTGRLSTITFDLVSDNVNVDTKGTAKPKTNDIVTIDNVNMTGLVDVQHERINIEAFSIKAGKARVLVAGTVDGYGDVPSIKLRGKLVNMPFHLIKNLWPPAAAKDARDWLVENLVTGNVTQGDLKVDITSKALRDAFNGAALPNEQLSFIFTVKDVVTRYLGALPLIRNARGVGHVQGDEFLMTMTKGNVKLASGARIALSKGSFFVRNLSKKGTIGEIKVTGNGATASIANLLDHEPLRYMTKFGIKPEVFGGDTSVSINLQLPMLKDLPLEAVTIRALAKLRKLRLPNAIGSTNIDGGGIDLDINDDGLNGKGKIILNGVPANLSWRENFNKSAGDTSKFTLNLRMDGKARRRFGIDLDDFIRGPANVSVKAVGNGPNLKLAQITADLSSTTLSVKSIGWRKPPGVKAQASVELHTLKDGSRLLKKLQIKGKDIQVQGALKIDGEGRLRKLDFPVVKLGKGNHLSLQGKHLKPNHLVLKVRGKALDARPILSTLLKSKKPDVPAPSIGPKKSRSITEIEAHIDRVQAHENEVLTKVKTSLMVLDGQLTSLKFASQLRDGSPLTISVTKRKNKLREVLARSPNAGAVMRAVGVYKNISKGQLRLEIHMPHSASGNQLTGKLRINRFSIVNEKALASLAAGPATAPATGQQTRSLGPSRAGPQRRVNAVKFNRLRVPFAMRGNHLIISNAIINGGAIGATAQGTIHTGTDKLNIRGTLIPAYGLNSLLGNVPVLGQVLVGGKGQGLFGLTFAMTGSLKDPKFTVNPISALAPGFLRLIFDLPNGTGVPGPRTKAPLEIETGDTN